MNFYLARTMAIILFSMMTACSFPWKYGSPKTEDKPLVKSGEETPNLPQQYNPPKTKDEFRVKSVDEMPSFPKESKTIPPLEKAPRPSSGSNVKTESKQLRSGEILLGEALESFYRSQGFWQKGEFSNAITALDQAYRLILQVNPDGDQDLNQKKEKIRLMICKRMVEIYATQNTTAKGSEKAIPLILNRYVEREINLFRGPERKFFLEAHKRSGRYRPMIAAALEKAGLPKELSWLPLIESGFRVNAFSSARALGLWQFIPSTGYKFGLSRDRWLDERMDPEKSTRAAIAYLQELHQIFGDWCTVLAAYNCGEARVLEVIRTQRINYLDNFWDLFEKLPQETARYVPRFIATLIIISNPATFGFDLEEPHPPFGYESVKISRPMFLKDVAKFLAVSSESLEDLNPELRLKITPPVYYGLKVPNGTGDFLLSRINEIPVSKPSQKAAYALHQVQRGETLIQLAGRYHTSVKAIAEVNHISGKGTLKMGQKLKIPAGQTAVGNETEEEVVVNDGNRASPRYRVKKGDTLRKIAEHYRTSLNEIMRLNHLESTNLQIDQEILIPPTKLYRTSGQSGSRRHN